MNDLMRLHKWHMGPASSTLALAFQDYPLLRYAFPDRAERERMVPYYCQMVLYYGLRYGEVYATSPDFEGVAAWITPGHYPMTFLRMVRSVPMSVMSAFGKGGGSRTKHPGKHIDAMHKRHAPFDHWFLLMVGVAPQLQGKGYAGVLMRPVLARLDEEGLPCYTETMDEKNVGVWGRFGFQVMEELAIPDTDLTSWALLRGTRQKTGDIGRDR